MGVLATKNSSTGSVLSGPHSEAPCGGSRNPFSVSIDVNFIAHVSGFPSWNDSSLPTSEYNQLKYLQSSCNCCKKTGDCRPRTVPSPPTPALGHNVRLEWQAGTAWAHRPLRLCWLRTTQSIHPPGDQQLLARRYFHREGYAPGSLVRNVSESNSEKIWQTLPLHGCLSFVSKELPGNIF